jgi:hypothetical protein
MIINPQGKTEVNSRQPLVANADGAVRLVFSPEKPAGVPDANWIQTNPEKGLLRLFPLVLANPGLLRSFVEDG